MAILHSRYEDFTNGSFTTSTPHRQPCVIGAGGVCSAQRPAPSQPAQMTAECQEVVRHRRFRDVYDEFGADYFDDGVELQGEYDQGRDGLYR